MGVLSFFLLIVLSFIFTAFWLVAHGNYDRENWLFAGSVAAIICVIFEGIAIAMQLNFGLWDELVLSIFIAYAIPMTLVSTEPRVGDS